MRLVDRIRQRISSTGLMNTLRYGGAVMTDYLYSWCQEMLFDLKFSGRLLSGNEKTRF